MLGLSLDAAGRIHAIDDDGMPAGKLDRLPSLTKPTLIMVHGFNFDPFERGGDNPHRNLFAELWRPQLAEIAPIRRGEWDVFAFGWYSGEVREAEGWAGAWMNGRFNPYRWAWDLAENAGGVLADLIGWGPEDDPARTYPEIMVMAHSLGSRVALEALHQLPPHRVSRVLLLNGAEYAQTAKVVAAYTRADVMNIHVRTDDVLDKLGETFAPERFMAAVVGRDGIRQPPPHWVDVQLDSPDTQTYGRRFGLELEGDDPREYSDHWYSYKHVPNWRLYRAFLAGHWRCADIKLALCDGEEDCLDMSAVA
ncbi:MAG: hypothetical protein ACFB3T_01190 [Geminicoccaceae bacterium]